LFYRRSSAFIGGYHRFSPAAQAVSRAGKLMLAAAR
jgi:hypothetical protein